MERLRWWRFALVALLALLIIQSVSWLIVGKSRSPTSLAASILEVTGGNFFVDDQSFQLVPLSSRSSLRQQLLANPSVYDEDELPLNNRREMPQNFEWADPIYLYEVPHFRLDQWTSTPAVANLKFSLNSGGFHGGKGFRTRYLWLGGVWVRIPATNPSWVS